MNFIIAVEVQVSPPPISAQLHSQTDTISSTGPHYLPKILGQKTKATTNVTLYESPMKLNSKKSKTKFPDHRIDFFEGFQECDSFIIAICYYQTGLQ